MTTLLLLYIPIGTLIRYYFDIHTNEDEFENKIVGGLIFTYSFLFFFFFHFFIFEIKSIKNLIGSNRNIFGFYKNENKPKETIPVSNSNDIIIKKVFEKIELLMHEKKVWLNPEYNSKQLSEDIGSNTFYVSQAINIYAKMNVKTYLNEFRLNAFINNIDKIKEGKASIKDIYTASGFNSQATFNRVFKHQFGISPIEYIEQKQN